MEGENSANNLVACNKLLTETGMVIFLKDKAYKKPCVCEGLSEIEVLRASVSSGSIR